LSESVTGRGGWRRAGRVAAALGLALTLAGCYKELTVEDTDTVGTFYDVNGDFASVRTYVLPDSVLHLGTGTNLTRTFDRSTLDRVAANLDNVGYRRIADPDAERPDVLVIVFGVQSQEWYAFSVFSWWNQLLWMKGLEQETGGKYELSFAWHPEEIYVFDAGSLFLLMLDLRHDEETETVPALWVAGISGLLAGTPSSINSRLVRNIDEAFVQSPYLRVTP